MKFTIRFLAKVSAWNWSESEMAAYATAFVLLSPLQQAMTWRPWLHLTGAKSTGKSSFFIHILQSLYGCLTQRLDKSTGFATAQTIGNTCKIPIFDEFEKNPKHIADILEMGKLCNAGGVKTSGRPNEKALEYEFHHLLWFGSIYKPAQMTQDGAQESRIVTLELKKLKDTAPILDEFEEEGHKIAAEIVAAMIFQWDEIQAKAKSIVQNRKNIMKKHPGIEIRTVDNFMYASAVLNLATQNQDAYTVPNWTSPTNEDDGEKILLTILHSRIKFNTNEHRMVSELVKLAEAGDTYPRGLLQQNGISIAKIKDKLYLAVRPQLVVKFLLKDDEYYRSLDISAPLGRVEGVEKNIGVRFGNQGTLKSIIIPMQHVNTVCGFEGQEEDCIASESNAGNDMVTGKVTPYIIDNELDKDISYQSYQENDRPYNQEFSFK